MNHVVKDYYDAKAEYEWNRLVQDAYHQLEYIVHMHFLSKYLPTRGLILDADGGPGRYTIELAKKGYQLLLLDLSPKCLEVAKREIKNANVEHNIKEIVEGSVVNLSHFSNKSFDAVICLSPLPCDC
jgi:ubiquinone/menaquinone biosynthesis C-methylase UbiE